MGFLLCFHWQTCWLFHGALGYWLMKQIAVVFALRAVANRLRRCPSGFGLGLNRLRRCPSGLGLGLNRLRRCPLGLGLGLNRLRPKRAMAVKSVGLNLPPSP